MDIMAYVLALIIQYNALAAAGYHYDPRTNLWTAPAPAVEVRETRGRLRIGREL